MSAPLHLRRAIERALQRSNRAGRWQPLVPDVTRPPIESLIDGSPQGAISLRQYHALRQRFNGSVVKKSGARYVDEQLDAWATHGVLLTGSTASRVQAAPHTGAQPPRLQEDQAGAASASGSPHDAIDACMLIPAIKSRPQSSGSSSSDASADDAPSTSNGSRPYGTGSMHAPKRNRWGKGLEADLRAVVIEAGLAPSCATAIVAAARNGKVPQNPGVLLAQLLKFQTALEGRVGRRALAALLRASPALVGASCDTLTWHWEELAAAWGSERATNMVMRAPLLLTTPPFMVWSHLDDLAQGLSMELDDARELAAVQPKLLTAGMDSMAQRLTCLAELLMLPPEQLRRLVGAQPSLLTYLPTTLQDNLEAIGLCLGVGRGRAARLVTRAPALLMLAPSTFAAKVDALSQMLGDERQLATAMVLRQPTVLSVSSELLATKLESLSQLLGISSQEMHVVAATNPAVLTLSHTTLERKLSALQAAVAAASELAKQQQPMPTQHLSPGSNQGQPVKVRGKGNGRRRARTSIAHERQQADAAASLRPHAHELGATPAPADGLTSLAGHMAAAWAVQYANTSPSVRAALACFSEARHARFSSLLEAVASVASAAPPACAMAEDVDTQQQPVDPAAVSLSAVLRMSDTQFKQLLVRVRAAA